jgi:hypothetical protein
MQPENKVVALVARRINHKRKKRAFIYEHRAAQHKKQTPALSGVYLFI